MSNTVPDKATKAALKRYPTQFYGRTWIFWAGTLLLGPFAILLCTGMVLFWFDIEQPVDDGAVFEMVLFGLFGLLFLIMTFISAFQVLARQTPILKIYKEGLWIRTIGTPIRTRMDFLIALTLLWRLVTLQLFQIRTVRLQWENIEAIPAEKGTLTITGWLSKKHDDAFQRGSASELEPYTSPPYEPYSFGVSIDKVREVVLYFWYNPNSRETLSSWQFDFTFDKQFKI